MAWSYSVFDEVRKPTVKELQEQYIQKGVDSSCAFSMACADYENSAYQADRVLHKISDEEMKAIPKGFKDKPSGVGSIFGGYHLISIWKLMVVKATIPCSIMCRFFLEI